MEDILNTIVAHKREQVAAEKRLVAPQAMQEEALASPRPGHSMRQALARSESGIIAEFKRRSPSKGWIKREADASLIPAAYARSGAAALSVLTDEAFFGGSLADLQTARQCTNLPLLRKDFIIDPYQVDQARAHGADAVLLIAACLTPDEAQRLAHHAHSLGMEVLLEVHSPQELHYLQCDPDMVGVNNRNLGTFVTDVNNSFRMAELLRQAVDEQSSPDREPPLLVSESGISQPDTIRRLREAGFRGFLIGETFMKTPSPAETLKQMLLQL